MNVFKSILKITLIISLLINSAGQGYALRPISTFLARSSITEAGEGLKLAENTTESLYRDVKEVLEETLEDLKLARDARIAIVGIASAARKEMAPGSDADLIILFGPEERKNKDGFVKRLEDNFDKRESPYHVDLLACGTAIECFEHCQRNPFAADGAKQYCLMAGDERLLEDLITKANESNMEGKSGFPFIIKADDPLSASSIFFDIWDYEREHIKFGGGIKSLPLSIKKGRGMMRDHLTVCMVGTNFYGIQGKNSFELLRNMEKEGYLDKEDSDKLAAALDFYLLVRNKLNSLYVARGGNLWDEEGKNAKDTIDSDNLEELVGDTGFSSAEDFLETLFRHQSNVLDIYKNIQKNLMTELRKIYSDNWVDMYEKACSKNALEKDDQSILDRCWELKEKGHPILFVLAWHSSHAPILEEIYRKKVPCLYILYALSCNPHTPKYILSDLINKKGVEYVQVVKRAKENLQERQAKKLFARQIYKWYRKLKNALVRGVGYVFKSKRLGIQNHKALKAIAASA